MPQVKARTDHRPRSAATSDLSARQVFNHERQIRARASLAFSILGLSFMMAGADKLLGLRAYERLFRHFGWSKLAMQAVGVGKILGGALVMYSCTRSLGGALLTVSSAPVLLAELLHRDAALALPRALLLLSAVATIVLPHHPSNRREA